MPSAVPAPAPAAITRLCRRIAPDHRRPRQTGFTRARRVHFVRQLASCGNVRRSAAAAGVSHQSAYRARGTDPAFRRAWDEAVRQALDEAEATLACRAIEGVVEEIWYRGAVVGSRRRHDPRLLLAYLARLDRMAAGLGAAELSEGFDAALARLASGDGGDAGASAGASGGPSHFSSMVCNMRSMSWAKSQAMSQAQSAPEGAASLAAPPPGPLDSPAAAAKARARPPSRLRAGGHPSETAGDPEHAGS